MTARTCVLTGLVALAVALPAFAQQQPRPPSDSNASTRRYCRVSDQIGTRLGAVRTCRTQAEWREADLEARKVTDRIQRVTAACLMGPNAPGQAHLACSN